MKTYQPTKKQTEAHTTAATYILFGGAVGGGKTAWLCNEAIQHCLQYAGARVFLTRHQLTSFRKTTLLTLLEFIPGEFVIQHNKTEHAFYFQNGSVLYYGGLGDDMKAIEKLKSMELSAYGIDQAEETSEDFFFMLNSRLRLRIKGVKYKAWLTANPTPNWVRQRFVDKAVEDHAFIPALPNENPFLPADYEEKLRKILPAELCQSWLDGDWNIIQSENSLFDYTQIREAMDREAKTEGRSCIGCDPARYGRDETVITMLRGNELTFEKITAKQSTMETAGMLIQATRGNLTLPVKLDSIGVGAGIADRLLEQKYNLREIVASARAEQSTVYKNLRAEAYFNFKNMLPGLKIPDDEKLLAQMMAIRYRTFSDGLLLIESKDELRRRGQPSPDRLDALVITCYGEGGEEIASDPSWAGHGASLGEEIEKEALPPDTEKGTPVDSIFLSEAQNQSRREAGVVCVPGSHEQNLELADDDSSTEWTVSSGGSQRKKKNDTRMPGDRDKKKNREGG